MTIKHLSPVSQTRRPASAAFLPDPKSLIIMTLGQRLHEMLAKEDNTPGNGR